MVSYDKRSKYYRVLYEDDDSEDLTLAELQELLAADLGAAGDHKEEGNDSDATQEGLDLNTNLGPEVASAEEPASAGAKKKARRQSGSSEQVTCLTPPRSPSAAHRTSYCDLQRQCKS